MQLIDSHCHIHDAEFFAGDSREEVYQRAYEAGVGMLVVGTSEADSKNAIEFAKSHAAVWPVVGVHPHEAKDGWGEIETLLKTERQSIVGVGEIGLDYYYFHSPREVQIEALEVQLQLAQDYQLPVSFHVREAFDDFWSVLDNFQSIKGVLHSFTDTQASLEQGLARGLFVGINGISTFTKLPEQQAMFAAVPLENMLIETDAPFLTPKQYRGKINEPAYVRLVAEHVAQVRAIDASEVMVRTTANTEKLFDLNTSTR